LELEEIELTEEWLVFFLEFRVGERRPVLTEVGGHAEGTERSQDVGLQEVTIDFGMRGNMEESKRSEVGEDREREGATAIQPDRVEYQSF
jgi:hypothetical protein